MLPPLVVIEAANRVGVEARASVTGQNFRAPQRLQPPEEEEEDEEKQECMHCKGFNLGPFVKRKRKQIISVIKSV